MIKVAVDVETSGFKPFWHDVISIGLAVYENDEDTPLATFYDKCRPWTPKTWNADSTKAHGFLLEDTLQWQDCRSLCVKALHFLKGFYRPGSYLPFVYHAESNFDYLHTQSLFIKADLHFSFYKVFNEQHTRSTLLKARELGYSGNKLSLWANRLNREFVHHNALDDALMCGAVDNYLIKNGGQDALKSITQQAPTIQQEGILQIAGLSALPSKGRKRTKIQR